MKIKSIFAKMGWSRKNPAPNADTAHNSVLLKDYPESSLAGQDDEFSNTAVVPLRSSTAEAAIKKKKDPAEVLDEAVNKLVDKLENINDNLDRQIKQNEQLVQKMDAIPDMLMSIPKVVEEQRKIFADVARQLQFKVEHDKKVAEELSGIHEKVAASAEVDARMSENIAQFSSTLGKLDTDTVSQTEWIQQMSKTLSASERYMKYTLSKQQTRFHWIFGIALGISFLAIVGLITGIVLLAGK